MIQQAGRLLKKGAYCTGNRLKRKPTGRLAAHPAGMTIDELAQRKAEIRQRLKQERSAIPEQEREAWTAIIRQQLLALDEVAAAGTIFCYISCGSEVGTRDLLDRFLEEGRTLLVPKIINANHMIATPFISWDDLVPGQLGILTPRVDEPYAGDVHLALTPGVGFSPNGYRIGYGRGYYDKWFAGHRQTFKIGLAFEAQLIHDMPVTDHDIPVDMIVTEKRVIQLPGA